MAEYEPWHGGGRFRIRLPDGREMWVTAKEFLAHRARYNAAWPHATSPSPGAGARRERNPGGEPRVREPAPRVEAPAEPEGQEAPGARSRPEDETQEAAQAPDARPEGDSRSQQMPRNEEEPKT